MSDQGARIYDVGYRAYDGPRSAPVWALVTIWRHTLQRVLGLHRSFRHKVLPGIALVIAFVPALIFVGIAAFLPVEPGHDEILPSYGEYAEHHRAGARALRLARGAGGALHRPAHGDARPLPRRPARRDALPRRQVGHGRERDAGDDGRPAAVPAGRLRRREPRPVGRRARRCSCSGSSSPGSAWRCSTPPSRWRSRA